VVVKLGDCKHRNTNIRLSLPQDAYMDDKIREFFYCSFMHYNFSKENVTTSSFDSLMQKGKKISTMQQFQGCCCSKVVVLAIRSNYMEQVML